MLVLVLVRVLLLVLVLLLLVLVHLGGSDDNGDHFRHLHLFFRLQFLHCVAFVHNLYSQDPRGTRYRRGHRQEQGQGQEKKPEYSLSSLDPQEIRYRMSHM